MAEEETMSVAEAEVVEEIRERGCMSSSESLSESRSESSSESVPSCCRGRSASYFLVKIPLILKGFHI